ncbi:MAG: Holliday junction resolvase RuvX [Blastocatellia bacterium]|nr:Holliday junction resolvase RuvX [Blastocatellia bacterium]MCS7158242.1 Holliday junction resolvase RuvX [Blastocatellia bacterium]MCX7753080.1 Holliday junction resolvase RuvX [Blastocatellia bacterium]MDW8169396.1 Holliday junction resolvase RuvX [Acidobacteriota bacterium]MDW8256463.1 Holliday junction resolvase RuvX [Acidobacteriota bacterium]
MRILAVDPGTRRIGLALCDELGISVRPLVTLVARGVERDARAIAEVARAHQVQGIVVGWPLNMDGTVGPAARRAEKLARRLRALAGVPISLWDERLTSIEAEALLRERGERPTPERVDQVAACVILQDFLAALRAHPDRPWDWP